MNGLAALALIVLFAQCAGNTDKQTTSAPAQAGGLSEMKIRHGGMMFVPPAKRKPGWK